MALKKIRVGFVLVMLLFSFQSKAQFFTFTVSGQIANTNSTQLAIYIQHPDSTGTVTDTALVSQGNYSFTFFGDSTVFGDSIYCSFINCNADVTDTLLAFQGVMQLIWNNDYCPTIQPPPGDTCTVSFTTSYCTCDNTFYIETDTSELGNHFAIWSFGDGTNSAQLFPTHTYTQNALYDVCIDVYDSLFQNVVCSYCHSIGFDSNGNPVTRNEGGSGFNLQIGPPGSATHESILPSNSISIYPNPTGNTASLNLYSDTVTDFDIRIFNSVGQQVKFFRRSAKQGNNNFQLELNSLAGGNYFMTVKLGEQRMTTVFVK